MQKTMKFIISNIFLILFITGCLQATPIDTTSAKGLYFYGNQYYLHYVNLDGNIAYTKVFSISTTNVVFFSFSDTLYYDKKKGIYINGEATIYQKKNILYYNSPFVVEKHFSVYKKELKHYPEKEHELEELINTTIPYSMARIKFKDLPSYLISNLGEMGIDTLEILNQYESNYLNENFKHYRKDFDFTDKKIFFEYACGLKKDKKYFFDDVKRILSHGSDIGMPSCELYIFNDKEK